MLTTNATPALETPRKASGFTLVEMLVAVALVLLMMSMFAKIFVDATSALAQQRGIAENDQRARRLTATFRNDVDGRTFRDVFPFRANEDTTQSKYLLSRRAGYFEIDEGNPYDNTDDVLQLTVSVQFPTPDANATGFIGDAVNSLNVSTTTPTLTSTAITGVPSTSSITISPALTSTVSPSHALVAINSYIWISGSTSGANDGRYRVIAINTTTGELTLASTANPLSTTLATSLGSNGSALLSESDPDFDDGFWGNSAGMSTTAEVCYFMRNGTLYRRVLLIRDDPTGTGGQPLFTTGINAFWYYNQLSGSSMKADSNIYPWAFPASTTFWRDFDYSAFFYPGMLVTTPGPSTATYGTGPMFHSSSNSMSNSSSGDQLTYDNTVTPPITYPLSLGNPAFRFGHSSFYAGPGGPSPGPSPYFGYPQQASSSSPANRFVMVECANSSFGYPGNIASGDPYDQSSTTLTYNGATGLVTQYSGQTARRGEDIVMQNVLSFDVKIWDPVNQMFVDLGDSTLPLAGPFSPTAPTLYDASGNVIGGAFYTTYAALPGFTIGGYPTPPPTPTQPGTFTFDTWHPNVKLGTNTTTSQEPPFVPAVPVAGAVVPLGLPNAGSPVGQPLQLQAIQISVNYRDVSTNQIRQVTIVQSLLDSVIPAGQ